MPCEAPLAAAPAPLAAAAAAAATAAATPSSSSMTPSEGRTSSRRRSHSERTREMSLPRAASRTARDGGCAVRGGDGCGLVVCAGEGCVYACACECVWLLCEQGGGGRLGNSTRTHVWGTRLYQVKGLTLKSAHARTHPWIGRQRGRPGRVPMSTRESRRYHRYRCPPPQPPLPRPRLRHRRHRSWARAVGRRDRTRAACVRRN